jgi:hypothetical protein
MCQGLDELEMEDRKRIVEAAGDCWYCGSKAGCPTCGSRKLKLEENVTPSPPERRGEKRKIGYGKLTIPNKKLKGDLTLRGSPPHLPLDPRPHRVSHQFDNMNAGLPPAQYFGHKYQKASPQADRINFGYKQEVVSPGAGNLFTRYNRHPQQHQYVPDFQPEPNLMSYQSPKEELYPQDAYFVLDPSLNLQSGSASTADTADTANNALVCGELQEATSMGSKILLQKKTSEAPSTLSDELWCNPELQDDAASARHEMPSYVNHRMVAPSDPDHYTSYFGGFHGKDLNIDPAMLQQDDHVHESRNDAFSNPDMTFEGNHQQLIGGNTGCTSAKAETGNPQNSNDQQLPPQNHNSSRTDVVQALSAQAPHLDGLADREAEKQDYQAFQGYPVDCGPDYGSYGVLQGYYNTFGCPHTDAQNEFLNFPPDVRIQSNIHLLFTHTNTIRMNQNIVMPKI